MACEDWEIYTTQMSAIFHCIIEFTLKENRSLPSMFSHLPYVSLDPDKVRIMHNDIFIIPVLALF